MKQSRTAALAALAATTVSVAALAHEHGDGSGRDGRAEDANGRHSVLEVALWGDEFYADDPAVKSAMIDQTIESMNSHDLDFTIFVGDTKNGSSVCSNEAIGMAPAQIFERLEATTLYSLGDNEWTDCHRTSNGPYDPLERLAYLRTIFFSKNTTQGGRHSIEVERQGGFGQPYSENSRFVRDRVEFVAVSVPGSNNNFVVTDDQCYKKSERTWDDCNAATAEYQERNAMDIAWLKEAFAEARERHYAGILIAIQADIYFPAELSDGGYEENFLPMLDTENGYTDFFNTLVEETHNYSGQVVLVHGDSHYFKLDKAMVDGDGRITRNFTRVEVFGSEDNSWVEMRVDPSSENVFSFEPVVLD